MKKAKIVFSTALLMSAMAASADQPADHLLFEGSESKPGQNKHVVLMAGDEEYRSEESLPMLAQILAAHGFRCTVLFSMDKDNTYVDPFNSSSLSNPGALTSADLILMSLRFRVYPDEVFAIFDETFSQGTPIVALRTSTHAFKPHGGPWSFYGKPFGPEVIGEGWVAHHGRHAVEGTRTVTVDANKDHPVLNGVGTIFGRTDVYRVNVRAPFTPLLLGQVTQSLDPESAPVQGAKNDPMMPVAWTRPFKHKNGKTSRIFATTMGSSDDLRDENLRRTVVNAVYWGLELPVPTQADVTPQSAYQPTMYGFRDEKDGLRKGYIRNMKPADYIDFISPKRPR